MKIRLDKADLGLGRKSYWTMLHIGSILYAEFPQWHMMPCIGSIPIHSIEPFV